MGTIPKDILFIIALLKKHKKNIHTSYLFKTSFYLEISNADSNVKIINSISDGVMEVFGIVSSFHMAQLQCGISKPVRIGQAKQIKVSN